MTSFSGRFLVGPLKLRERLVDSCICMYEWICFGNTTSACAFFAWKFEPYPAVLQSWRTRLIASKLYKTEMKNYCIVAPCVHGAFSGQSVCARTRARTAGNLRRRWPARGRAAIASSGSPADYGNILAHIPATSLIRVDTL